MLISQKPDYARRIEEDRLSPFSNDEVLLNLADKKLSNAVEFTAHTYYNFAIVLNCHIERALACESPRLQPAVQRLCELSSLVGKAADIRVTDEEQKSLSAFTKALLARRAADLILVHHATSSLNTKSTPEWKVCVSALSRLALYWLAACKHTTPATSALVALEALEANSIRKHLAIDEDRVDRLLQNPECAERLGDACGAACPSATSSPSRSGLSFTPTLISFVPLGGFERCIQEAVDKEAPPPLSEEKYAKCIGALSETLENSMVLRRLVNVMRIDSSLSSGSFVDSLFPSLPAYPEESSFKGRLFNSDVTRFDIKCYLVFLMGWTRVRLSSPLSSITGASRLLSPAPLAASILTQHQITLWNSLVLRALKRFTGAQHALSVQGVKKVTRLMTAPPVPLMGTLFYTIRDDSAGEYVAELYARKIVETICCSDSSADRTVFRSPQGGIEFDTEDETRLLNDASIFISGCEMRKGDWIAAERTVLMCEEEETIVGQLIEVYSAWLKTIDVNGDTNGRKDVEKKLKDMKAKMEKLYPSPSRSDKENDNGRKKESLTSLKESAKTRSPAISIEGDDLNNSIASSEYASAPSTPFKNGTIFGAETPTFHTPGGRPSLWPGAIQRNLFMQATQNASSTPKTSRPSIPIECREEEVQTDGEDSIFVEPSVSSFNLNQTYTPVTSSRHRSPSIVSIPEDQFELESLMQSLDLINDGFSHTKEKVDQVEKAHEEEREDEKRRKEVDEKSKRGAEEEIRIMNEKMMIMRANLTPKRDKEKKKEIPSRSVQSMHRPLGAAPTVDALPDISLPPSLPHLPPPQQQLLHMYLQQQPLFAAANPVPPTTTGGSQLQQLLGAVSGPASVQSPGIQRMGEIQNGGWTVPRPQFAQTAGTMQKRIVELPKTETQPPAPKPKSAFEAAYLKKKEEEEREKEGLHKGCICCANEEEQDRWFATYDRMVEKYDAMN